MIQNIIKDFKKVNIIYSLPILLIFFDNLNFLFPTNIIPIQTLPLSSLYSVFYIIFIGLHYIVDNILVSLQRDLRVSHVKLLEFIKHPISFLHFLQCGKRQRNEQVSGQLLSSFSQKRCRKFLSQSHTKNRPANPRA